ncbi:hypothetical protein IAT40_003806 [Kwoniella sp. CBS 6097]
MVPRRWLRLYTDSALLLSIAEVLTLSQVKQQQKSNEEYPSNLGSASASDLILGAIRRLDMAIIVAGAIGRGRKEWILQTIKDLQRLVLVKQETADDFHGDDDGESDAVSSERPKKRQRLQKQTVNSSPSATLRCAPSPISTLSTPPSIDEYLQHHSQRPFILRGYLAGGCETGFDNDELDEADFGPPPWPAVERWRSAEYLKSMAGKGRVVPVEVGGAYVDVSWTQKIIPFDEFLSVSGFDSKDKANNGACPVSDNVETDPPSQPLYLAQYALFDQFPDLAKDISYPDYVWSEPPVPVDYPTYRPPQTEDGVIVNVWIGSGEGKIVSPAHTDPYYNCYAQVVGRKRVWLAPPKCGPYMHAYGTKGQSKSAGPSQGTTAAKSDTDANTLADQYMTNTSKIPIFRHKGELFTELKSTYPDFCEHVWPESLEAVLGPGDLLVMPPGWWHAMTGEGDGPGWSVSMWY